MALIIRAIMPISVCSAVDVTTPFARPRVTSVPLNTILTRSAIGAFTSMISSARFTTAALSPVSADSSTCRFTHSISCASAGTKLPASRKITSPGTTSRDGTETRAPSRSTIAFGDDSLRNSSSAASARFSCTRPITAFSSTIASIAAASITSPSSSDTADAATSSNTTKSMNCAAKRRHSGTFSTIGSSL